MGGQSAHPEPPVLRKPGLSISTLDKPPLVPALYAWPRHVAASGGNTQRKNP